MSRFADDDDSGGGSYESSTDSEVQPAHDFGEWEDNGDDDDLVRPEPCMSLFTTTVYDDADACVTADSQQFGFDLAQCFAAGALDTYERIKLVNYIRSRVKALQHPTSDQQYGTRAELLDALKAAAW